MIKKIQIINHLGDWLTMELRFPEKSGFLIRSIDGLGPNKAEINISEIFAIDGAVFNSSRITSRNLVFNLTFLPNPTIEDTRQFSYKYFPIKQRIDILIETDTKVFQTYGYVESNVPNIFSKQEGCSISIICPNAYLFSTTITTTIITHFEPNFEFPFSNESLVSKLIEMGYGTWRSDDTKNVYYSGDVEIGILIIVNIIGSGGNVTNLSIFNVRTLETISIDSTILIALTGYDLHVGDIVYISTVKGNKYATLVRDGTTYNIINCLGQNPIWLKLQRGDNIFDYDADSGVNNAHVTISKSNCVSRSLKYGNQCFKL